MHNCTVSFHSIFEAGEVSVGFLPSIDVTHDAPFAPSLAPDDTADPRLPRRYNLLWIDMRPPKEAAFLDRIQSVLFRSAKEEMFQVDTFSVVAFVASRFPVWNINTPQPEDEPRDGYELSFEDGSRISGSVKSTVPLPAAGGAFGDIPRFEDIVKGPYWWKVSTHKTILHNLQHGY